LDIGDLPLVIHQYPSGRAGNYDNLPLHLAIGVEDKLVHLGGPDIDYASITLDGNGAPELLTPWLLVWKTAQLRPLLSSVDLHIVGEVFEYCDHGGAQATFLEPPEYLPALLRASAFGVAI
jgi:hypothetical protein